MKYPVCGIATFLICLAFLLATGATAQQTASPAPEGGAIGFTYHPRCTEKEPKPDCISAPRLVSSVPPMYSEEARKAKIEGSVVLGVSVDEKGNLSNFRVISSLGTGLDEKAIEAVKAWKFESAYGKDGKPVATGIFVEVSFHL